MLRTNLSKNIDKTTNLEGTNSTKNPQNDTKNKDLKKLDYSNNPINVSKKPVLQSKQRFYKRNKSVNNETVKYFYSLDSFQKNELSKEYNQYIKDNLFDYSNVWQAIGLHPSKSNKYATEISRKFGAKLSFFKNRVWLLKDFKSDKTYNPHTFAKDFLSENRKRNQFYSEILNLKSFKDFAAEKRETKRFKTSKTSTNTDTTKTDKKPLESIKTDLEKETKAYFEKRIYSELGLTESESKKYFFPSFDNYFGIGIKYTDLDQNCIKYGSENKEFDRIRLTVPEGKKKYHSTVGSGYFPYITPLAHNQNLLNQDVLYSIEGEFKAFFACHKLEIPCIGIGGIHLGITIESKINKNGNEYKDKYSSEFLPLTKEVIEKGKFESYQLVFDSDTFRNQNKKTRSYAFSTAIERQIIAAQKVGIKEFTFTCINPNNVHDAKGLDDLANHCEPSEIKAKLQDTSYHNDLFWHFRIDISKPIEKAFQNLKDAFSASVQPKKETQKIVTTGYIGHQLTNDLNSPFVTSLISQKFTSLVAPTGLGKSYFIEKIFVPFMYELGFITIFCSPRNALTIQQASESKGIVFTEKTNQNAIDRLKFEIDSTKMVFSNFDNLNVAYEVLTKFHSKSVYIVIDESHLLTSDSTFRPQTISKVCDTLEKNPLNLFLTATPTEIKLSKELSLFEVVSTDKKPYERPMLVFTPKNKKLDCTLECIQKAVRNNKRVLVHYNHLDSCKALKKELERLNINTRICASDGLDVQDLEFFESIKNNDKFVWNNDVKVILTTSVLEIGINLKTDRNTSLFYVNCAKYGFDVNSYLQFIARIRNYTSFKIQNTIITTNQKSFLPSNDLVLDFDFDLEALEYAKENAKTLNKIYQKLKKQNSEVKRDRFVSKDYQNVLFNKDKECFEINLQDVFSDYTTHTIAKGSPFFCNPSKVVFYEKENLKELKKAVESIQDEKETAEKAVFELYENDFYTLLKSVHKYTKDVKLQAKTNLKSNPNEPIQLNAYELLAAENLLRHHFQLSKTVKTDLPNDLECKEIKQVITCKESRTIRKTSDLAKRKKAYITYFLLLSSDTKYRVRESKQVEELQRIISILESLNGKEITIFEVLKLANKNRYGKSIYNKKSFLELCQILFEFEVIRKVESNKKLTFYSFEKSKNFLLEMERLRA